MTFSTSRTTTWWWRPTTSFIRGLELKNAGIHGVLIRGGVQHVVVEDCHITGWGRLGGARVWGVTSGIR